MSSRCLLLPVCHCLSVCQSPCEAKNLGGTYSLVQLRLDTKGWRAPRVSFLISVGGRQSDCLAYFPAPHCQTLCGGDRSCCLWDLCIAVLRYLKLLGFKKGKFAWLPEVHVPLALLLQTCSDSIYHRRSLWQKWLIDRMVARKQREKNVEQGLGSRPLQGQTSLHELSLRFHHFYTGWGPSLPHMSLRETPI